MHRDSQAGASMIAVGIGFWYSNFQIIDRGLKRWPWRSLGKTKNDLGHLFYSGLCLTFISGNSFDFSF